MFRLLPLAFLAVVPFAAIGAPVPKQVLERDAITKRFGTLNDPGKESAFAFEGEKLVVRLPKPTNRTTRELTFPHTARAVSGDFVLQVKVSYPLPEKVPALGAGACAAGGLYIWDGANNHVLFHRFHQPCGLADGTTAWSAAYTTEYNRPAKPQHHHNAPAEKGAPPVHLRLTREKGTVTPAYSYDGKEWKEQQPGPMEFPEKVMVGVYALQTAGTPATVAFERFTVTPIGDPAKP